MNSNDILIAQVTGSQHGAARRAQLLDAGLTPAVLDRRVRGGQLNVVHRGVYRAASHPVTPWTLATAAVLAAAGKGAAPVSDAAAAISHAAAAVLWNYPCIDFPDIIDVTGPRVRRVPGLRAHQVRSLPDDEVTHLRGVPVTTPARTVLDVAGRATMRELEQVLAAAERGAPRRRQEINRLLARYPRHPGSGALRRLLRELQAAGRKPLFLRSKAEERALLLMVRARLPMPQANVRVAGLEVDFVWRSAGVVLEVDGLEFHGGDVAFHRDRARDRTLVAAGFQVLRFTWRQLSDEPEACIGALAVALSPRIRARPRPA
jgi:very-short-patch-repair endonuclease